MESFVLGLILGYVTYLGIVGPHGLVVAVALGLLVFFLTAGGWDYVVNRRR